MQRYGLLDRIGEDNLYPTIGSAVHAYIHASGVDWVDWQDAEEPYLPRLPTRTAGREIDEPSRD